MDFKQKDNDKGCNAFLRVKSLLGKLYSFLQKPFERNLYLFLSLLFLFNAVDLFYVPVSFILKAKLFLHSFFLAFLFASIATAIKSKLLRRTYLSLLLSTAGIVFVVDCFCAMVYQSRFNVDFAGIVLSTNYVEVEEYLSFYLSPLMVLSIVGCLSIVAALVFVIKNRLPKVKNRYVDRTLVTLLVLGAFTSATSPEIWKEVYLGKMMIFNEVEPVPDLREHLTNPEMNINERKHPANVVVVIGESLSRYNCSLYGYEKETNPLLEKLQSSGKGELVLYNDVKSPALATITSFSCLLSVYKSGMFHGKEWHHCPSLPEIVNILGYNTYWVSNQSRSGLNDNLVTRYAELCKEEHFTSSENVGRRHKSHDEEVLPLIEEIRGRVVEGEKSFYFVHLMGSHYQFNERYPEEFNKFKPAEYSSFPNSQRENRAYYDNSVLYTDYVVSEIIRQFENEETLLFFFPDHSIDLYRSSADYVGHGKYANDVSSKYGHEIPFIVYVSDKYKQRFPAEVERIRKYVDKDFSTNDFVLSVMDILGSTFKVHHDVQLNSLFRDKVER